MKEVTKQKEIDLKQKEELTKQKEIDLKLKELEITLITLKNKKSDLINVKSLSINESLTISSEVELKESDIYEQFLTECTEPSETHISIKNIYDEFCN
jgi:hypothetical protein